MRCISLRVTRDNPGRLGRRNVKDEGAGLKVVVEEARLRRRNHLSWGCYNATARWSLAEPRMLADVKQKPIEPFIKSFIARGSLIYTDEYCIYDRLEQWGYEHQAVNHSAGEYARDEDGDGFHEVHVNTIESLACAKDGHCFVLGSDPTAASRKRSCRFT